MAIDPIVIIAEELKIAGRALEMLSRQNTESYSRARAEKVNCLLEKILRLNDELHATNPTSAIGAAELIRIAAGRLPFSHGRYAAHLHEVADRMAAGNRLHGDLVWLRAVAHALDERLPEDGDHKVSCLLEHSIIGAARPVLIYRADDVERFRADREAEEVAILARVSGEPFVPTAFETA